MTMMSPVSISGFNTSSCPCFQQVGVVIGLGAVQAHDATARRGVGGVIDQEAGLQRTDLDGIEGDEVEDRCRESADRKAMTGMCGVRQRHGFRHRGAVVRHHHQHVDATCDQRLDIAGSAACHCCWQPDR